MNFSNYEMFLLLSAFYSVHQTRALKRLPETAKEELREVHKTLRELIKASGHKIHSEQLMNSWSIASERDHFQRLAEEELFCEHGATTKDSCPLCEAKR